ncbi:PepSY domain-containing protein [Arthrobacter sp. PAMC25284]|uniref:PepSY domain-containing protein n=1 Tax=Arthrobacter sp. PAMC25284 TaxID=2861279 RepID=UPI001C63A003|nr:hypothetical protein [Arthrobacter sp. PAMC25284]QYF89003.1 hypothetical protein KY499_12545 [Arthrobacter sp. PAMC25284]
MGRKTALLAGAAAAAVLLGGAAVAAAAANQLSRNAPGPNVSPIVAMPASIGWDDDDDDFGAPPLSAADQDRAANVALAQVGQGRVSEIERENGGAAYEVEVRLDNGTQVEVLLGPDFQVLYQGAPEYDDD